MADLTIKNATSVEDSLVLTNAGASSEQVYLNL